MTMLVQFVGLGILNVKHATYTILIPCSTRLQSKHKKELLHSQFFCQIILNCTMMNFLVFFFEVEAECAATSQIIIVIDTLDIQPITIKHIKIVVTLCGNFISKYIFGIEDDIAGNMISEIIQLIVDNCYPAPYPT